MNCSSCKFKNLLLGQEDLLNLFSLVYTSLLSTHHMIEVSHFSTPSFVFPRNALYVYVYHRTACNVPKQRTCLHIDICISIA